MKKNATNYAMKILGLTIIAFAAMAKTAFCQQPAIDNDLITYLMAVSPDQKVKFRLPKDIRSGDMITGTVVEEPQKNAVKTKASSTLEGMVIEIEGKQSKISNHLISFMVPAGITSLPFLLRNSAGEVIERAQIPVGVFSHVDTRRPETFGSTDTKFSPQAVSQPGQILQVSGPFDGNASNTNVSLNNQACENIAESPRTGFVQVQENATAGVTNLTITENNFKEEHKINVVTLDLSVDKTNLLKGGKATLKVIVSGLEGLTAENMNYSLNVENLSPQTISFLKEGGNIIAREINAGSVKNGQYEFSTKIIALATGPFSVQALFFKPVSKNPCVDAYYECVKFADEDYEYKSRNCGFTATGNKRTASTCQALLIKEREERKAACLQELIRCMR